MTEQQAQREIDMLNQWKAKREWSKWIRRNWTNDPYSPLFETDIVEKDGQKFPHIRKDRYQGRPVLKRHSAMYEVLRAEIIASLSQYAISQPNPIETWDQLVPSFDKRDETLLGLEETLDQLDDGDVIKYTMEIGGTKRTIPLEIGREEGLDGIMYLMFTRGDRNEVIPLYIGISRLTNDVGHLNQLINHRSDAKFGRWGYGRENHLGALSNVVFEYGWDVSDKYGMWADELLFNRSRLLKKSPIMFSCQVWGSDSDGSGGLEEAEKWTIKLASKAYPEYLLNVQHRETDHTLDEY